MERKKTKRKLEKEGRGKRQRVEIAQELREQKVEIEGVQNVRRTLTSRSKAFEVLAA